MKKILFLFSILILITSCTNTTTKDNNKDTTDYVKGKIGIVFPDIKETRWHDDEREFKKLLELFEKNEIRARIIYSDSTYSEVTFKKIPKGLSETLNKE